MSRRRSAGKEEAGEANQTCHQAGPGIVSWKKFLALQTIERVFPGAMGMLKEQIQMTHFWSPRIGSFVSISILITWQIYRKKQPCDDFFSRL